MDIKQLRQQVDDLFSKRTQFMILLQEIAENFYPERADFTVRREVGDEFASNLMSSYPVLCRRDLGDQVGTMLRQSGKEWFHMSPVDDRREDNDAKRWLQWATGVQRRAMYDRKTLFTRATKEADHDFAAFGQAVISARLNKNQDALLYRCWHIRDVVWLENEDGEICLTARKWKPYAKDLKRIFGSKNHTSLEADVNQNPFQEIECYHIVLEMELYDGPIDKASAGKMEAEYRRDRYKYVSVYYDIKHDHVIEAIPTHNREYIIPRWQTVSGSQYAYSPATIAALPDARLIQAMTYTLLEAGEKAVTPPMIATQDAVRSDVAVYAGGITWVDQDYDEKLGEALRPLTQDLRGIPLGIDMQRDARQLLMQAFFLNKLNLPRPETSGQMTAYEIGQRIQEYIRGAMPIFEPMEMEYNGAMCEATFDLLLRGGAFGDPRMMPRSLQGADIQFRFESPLHDAIEAQKGQKFIEMNQLIAQAINLDQSVIALPDAKVALRDALNGIGVPAKWVRNETTVQQIEQAQRAAVENQQLLDTMEQSSVVTGNLAKAERDMAAA